MHIQIYYSGCGNHNLTNVHILNYSDLSQGCNWWLIKGEHWSYLVEIYFIFLFCLSYEKKKDAFIWHLLFISYLLVAWPLLYT